MAGAAVIFEVQRSSRSEARKEELRKQELEVHIDIHNNDLLVPEKFTTSLSLHPIFFMKIDKIFSIELIEMNLKIERKHLN